MASFGSFRVAKGVRISASSRGLRAHVGPRGARVHLGGGRTGVSTGAGPYTYYTSGGSRGTSRRSGNAGPTKTEIARAEKLAEGTRLQDEIRSIVEIHRVTFPPIRKPDVERPVRPTIDSFLESREKSNYRRSRSSNAPNASKRKSVPGSWPLPTSSTRKRDSKPYIEAVSGESTGTGNGSLRTIPRP